MTLPRRLIWTCVALLVGCASASADDYILTFNGTEVNSTLPNAPVAYANTGDALTGTFTLRDPIAAAGTPGHFFQATSSAPGDDPFQDSTTTGVHMTTVGESGLASDLGAEVGIFSGYEGFSHNPVPIYGYQFTSDPDIAPATYDPGYEFWQLSIVLESTQSMIAPTGTLSDLGTFPVIDFDYANSFTLTLEQASYNTNMAFTGYVPQTTESGVINSYAIQKTVTPEPSTWMLVVMGVAGVVGVARTRRAARA